MAQCQGSGTQMVKLVFGFQFHLYLAGKCCEDLQSAKGPAQCKSWPSNNRISKRNHHSIVPCFNYHSPPPRQFLYVQILLKKNQLGEMKLLKMNLNRGALGPLVLRILLQLIIFMTNLRNFFEWIIINR